MGFLKYTAAFLVIGLALVINSFVQRTRVFYTPINYNNQDCFKLAADRYGGMEDITKIAEDDNSIDFIGAYEFRRHTWLDHSFQDTWPKSKYPNGLTHIRISKEGDCQSIPSSEFVKECIVFTDLNSEITNGDKIAFRPHGIFFDDKKNELHVLNHASFTGGDRLEVFQVDVSSKNKKDEKKQKVVSTKHLRSITYAAGYPLPSMETSPYNWTLWSYRGVAPPSSAFGVFNDFAIDRVNNRFIISQWKGFPNSMYAPVKKFAQDHFALALLATLVDPTFFLSCPLESSTPSDPDWKQCIRGRERFGLANGVMTNKAGNMIMGVDFVNRKVVFMTANKIGKDTKINSAADADFSPFNVIGSITTNYSWDNIEFHSENENEICITGGGDQRVIDPAIYVEHNRFSVVPSAVSKICCRKDAPSGIVQNPIEDCKEEILYQTDSKDTKRHLSGISVGIEIESGSSWRKKADGKNILVAGSYFDEGVGFCFV